MLRFCIDYRKMNNIQYWLSDSSWAYEADGENYTKLEAPIVLIHLNINIYLGYWGDQMPFSFESLKF